MKYSGLIVILTSWFFLLLPFIYYRKYLKKIELISDLAHSPSLCYVVTIGVIMAGFFQVLFGLYFVGIVSTWLGLVGSGLFSISGILFLFGGLISINKNKSIHNFFIKSYFVLMSGGAFLISLNFLSIKIEWALIAAIVILIMFIYAVICHRKNKSTASEVGIILLSNLWAVIIYLGFIL